MIRCVGWVARCLATQLLSLRNVGLTIKPLTQPTLLLLIALPSWGAEIPAERQRALRDLLKQDCGACHGLTLKGGMGPALLPENLAGKSDDFLADTILNGRRGTAMPPWQPFMNRDEALWLVEILRKQPH